jgi:nitroimidazol reductase NimA-like FMN-containing flavoprotein (pyridoxamine 5'-phosphate oxidase superfamily)
MRRLDRNVQDPQFIADVIQRSSVCRLGLADGDQPYVVPLCFGLKDRVLYFHCASQGHKLDILRKNNKVCLEFDIDTELVKGDKACRWSMRYRSVIAFGTASFIHDIAQKREALNIIMNHYGNGPWSYSEAELTKVFVVKVNITEWTCKVRE